MSANKGFAFGWTKRGLKQARGKSQNDMTHTPRALVRLFQFIRGPKCRNHPTNRPSWCDYSLNDQNSLNMTKCENKYLSSSCRRKLHLGAGKVRGRSATKLWRRNGAARGDRSTGGRKRLRDARTTQHGELLLFTVDEKTQFPKSVTLKLFCNLLTSKKLIVNENDANMD